MQLYFFFTLVLAKFTIIWPTDPLKRGELSTENLQNSRGFYHSTRSPFKQYPSTLVKQEINPEQAEEHNVSERSKQNVIGQHQLIEPKQEFDQQPTAPVAINAQIKTEPLEIETKLTLFNKQLTPKNEHLQLNTEEGTSGNMNGNLNRVFKVNENEKHNLLNESYPPLPETSDMDISLQEATPSHGYKDLLSKEKMLPQGEKEREMGKEKASVQAENAQATEEEALKQGENATEMEKEALQQKEKALAIEEEALLRKGKALALEEGEIERSGDTLLQGEQEREMGKEVQAENAQATEMEKEALQQKEKALAIEEEALLRKGKALGLEEGEIDPSEEALLQREKEREMGEEEASVQAENVQATEEEALKQGENATEMEKEALQQKEKALAIEEEEALLRKGKALALEEGEIEPSGTALLQEEQEREMGKEGQAENAQATEKEALKQGENATEMEKEALQQKEKALAIEEALLRKGKALELEEGEIEPSGTALLQEEQEREMGEEEASIQAENVQATEEEQHKNFWDTKGVNRRGTVSPNDLDRRQRYLSPSHNRRAVSRDQNRQNSPSNQRRRSLSPVQPRRHSLPEQNRRTLAPDHSSPDRNQKHSLLSRRQIDSSVDRRRSILSSQSQKLSSTGKRHRSPQDHSRRSPPHDHRRSSRKHSPNRTLNPQNLNENKEQLPTQITDQTHLRLLSGIQETLDKVLKQLKKQTRQNRQILQAHLQQSTSGRSNVSESKSKQPRNQDAQPSSSKFIDKLKNKATHQSHQQQLNKLTIQSNDIHLSPHTQQNQRELHDQHQQSLQLHQSLLNVESEQPVQTQHTPNIQTYFSDLSIKVTDRFLNTDIEWLIFVTIKAIKHPISFSDFQLMWQQNKEQSVDEILTLIDGVLFEQTLTAEQIIKLLKAVLTQIGTDVTILLEIGIEMTEFEQKFSENLSNEAVSTAKELKMLFLFMRLFKKSLILLSEDIYNNEDEEKSAFSDWLSTIDCKINSKLQKIAQTAVFPFSNAVKWVFTISKLENTLAIVDVAILLTSPSSMKTTFKYLGNPTMNKDIFSTFKKNEFLAQFNSWINPWAEPNHLHLIRTKIGKNASSKIVAALGDIFNEQIAKLNEKHPNSVQTGLNQLVTAKYNRLLHWNVFFKLRLALDSQEFDSISIPKLVEARSNGIAYLAKCTKSLN